METDLEYFRRRASEEYLSYANAGHPAVRRTHLALAQRYEALARAIETDNQHSIDDGTATDSETGERLTLWL